MRILLISLLLLVFLSNTVMAAAFTSSVLPQTVNVSSTPFMNFTVGNTDSLNITEVNITLPNGFSYSGNAGTGLSNSSFIAVGNTLKWHGFQLGGGSTGYFWFKASTPSSIGSYDFNISALDANNSLNSAINSVTVNDNIAPRWYNLTSSPQSPAKYSPTATYHFNVTWTDNIALSEIYFESNVSGSMQNYSAYNIGSLFYYSYDGLAVGSYPWKFYAIDTSGNINSTQQSTLAVQKPPNLINLTVNGVTNKDTQSNYKEPVTVQVKTAGTGRVHLFQDGILVASVENTNSLDYTASALSIGSHTFKATINNLTDSNYLDNNTGVSYKVNVDWPAPKWDAMTNITPVYSQEFTSTIFVIWDDINDYNGFNASLIEMNFSGKAVNYTMLRAGETRTALFNVTLPAGSFYWKAYANNSFGKFNTTARHNFTVAKAVAPVNLEIDQLYWEVAPNTEINISCNAPSPLKVNLYRNSTRTSNPDVEAFSTEVTYLYVCNTTSGNQNYTTGSSEQLLVITSNPSRVLRLYVSASEKFVQVVQSGGNTINFQVTNKGSNTLSIEPFVIGVNKESYYVNPSVFSLKPGESTMFAVIFANVKEPVGDHNISFAVQFGDTVLREYFTLRVLPSAQTITSINNDLLYFKSQLDMFSAEIKKLESKGDDTASLEGLYARLESNLETMQDYADQNDYFNASALINPTKQIVSQMSNLLSTPGGSSTVTGTQKSGSLAWVVVALVVVGGVLAFVFLRKKIFASDSFTELKEGWDELKRKWENQVAQKKEEEAENR